MEDIKAIERWAETKPVKDNGWGYLADAQPIDPPPAAPVEETEAWSRPSDLQLEQQVLFLLLDHPDLLKKYPLRADYFDPIHQLLFKTIVEAADDGAKVTDKRYLAALMRLNSTGKIDIPGSMTVFETISFGLPGSLEPDINDASLIFDEFVESYIDRVGHRAINKFYDNRKKIGKGNALRHLIDEITVALGKIESASTALTPQLQFVNQSQEAADDIDDWLWDGFLRKGWLTILAGFPKTGKSTLLRHVLKVMSHGGGDCHSYVKATKAIVVTEEPESIWREKNEDFGIGQLMVMHGVQCPSQGLFIDEMTLIRQAIESHGIELVVFDTASKLLPGIKENETDTWHAAIAILKQHLPNVAILLVSHTGKNLDAAFGRQIRGASAQVGAADIVITIDRTVGSDRRRRVHTLGRCEAQEFLYEYDPIEETIAEVDALTTTDRKEQILKACKTWVSEKEVCSVVQLGRSQTQRLLGQLVKANLIKRTGQGSKAAPFKYRV